jgi:phenylglyoxylate dehydrogenase epsilon subunit
VIVGNSHAGVSALERIHKLDPQSSTIIVSEEEEPSYSPTSLTAFIAGDVKEQDVGLRPKAFYDQMNARVLLGRRAEGLDAKKRRITFADGSKLAYDQLLVATGSRPAIPRIEGLGKAGALSLRTLQDARWIIKASRESRKAVIIGAGLIGMEAAPALKKRGLDVTVIEMLGRVLPLYFDEDAASIIDSVYQEQGIKVLKTTMIHAVERGAKGWRLNLNSGERLDADLVLVATGVRSNVEFLKGSGIQVAEGVLVNERMQTSDPSIYAAGDVAQGKRFLEEDKVLTPTVLNAVYQGQVAGSNMAGEANEFVGGITMNVFNFYGNVAFSVGQSLDGQGLEVLKEVDQDNRRLKKLVLQDGKLVGCAMINQGIEPGLPRRMIMERWQADEVKKHFHDDLASAFRRTLVQESGGEMAEKRRKS